MIESSSLSHILGHTHLPYFLYLYPITDSITSGISITAVTLTAIPAVKPFGVSSDNSFVLDEHSWSTKYSWATYWLSSVSYELFIYYLVPEGSLQELLFF